MKSKSVDDIAGPSFFAHVRGVERRRVVASRPGHLIGECRSLMTARCYELGDRAAHQASQKLSIKLRTFEAVQEGIF